MERYKRDRDSYGYNYFDCYDCEYYVSYHTCNRCYKKENTSNKWHESDEEIPNRLRYTPADGEDDDDWWL